MTEFEPDAAGYARLIEQGDKTIRLIDKYNTRKVCTDISIHAYHYGELKVPLV